MGIQVDYFICASDDDAISVCSQESSSEIHATVDGRRLLPHTLIALEAILGDRAEDDIWEDKSSFTIFAVEDELTVIRLGEAFESLVAATTPDVLSGATDAWLRAEDMTDVDVKGAHEFTSELRELILKARTDGQRVYCSASP